MRNPWRGSIVVEAAIRRFCMLRNFQLLRIFLNTKNQNSKIQNQVHCCKPGLCAACAGMAAPPVEAWSDEGLNITEASKMAMSAKVRHEDPVADQRHVKNLLDLHTKLPSLGVEGTAFLRALTTVPEGFEKHMKLRLTLACFLDNEVLQSITNDNHKKMFTRALTHYIASLVECGVPTLVGTTCIGRWHARPYLESVGMNFCVTRYVLRTQGRRRSGLTFCSTRSLEQPSRPRTSQNGCSLETQRSHRTHRRWWQQMRRWRQEMRRWGQEARRMQLCRQQMRRRSSPSTISTVRACGLHTLSRLLQCCLAWLTFTLVQAKIVMTRMPQRSPCCGICRRRLRLRNRRVHRLPPQLQMGHVMFQCRRHQMR